MVILLSALVSGGNVILVVFARVLRFSFKLARDKRWFFMSFLCMQQFGRFIFVRGLPSANAIDVLK